MAMKAIKFRTMAMAFAAAVAALLPTPSFAANTLVNSTGVNDETLFIILALVAFFQLVVILVIAGVIKSIAGNKEIWQMRWNKGMGAVIAVLLSLASTPLMAAQDADFDKLITMDDTGFVALVTINLILFFTFIYLTSKLNGLIKMMMKDEEGKVPKTFMDEINDMLTAAVPIEQESSVEMDHEYDGIRELDNRLPPWWLWGFYFTIAFGIVYLINYHISGSSPLQTEEYMAEMEAAAEAKAAFVATQSNVVDESNVELLTDAGALGNGQKTFKLYCAPCHGENGGSMPGGVGPNLTDDYWIHGGSVTDIFKTIKYGVPAKGMVSWEAQLSPSKIQEVASYIKSIYGTNPENAKEPQGDLWQEAAPEAAPAGEAPADSTVADGGEITAVE